MIKRVWSDLDTFRAVEFTHGMNVVLADTSRDSDETESTNGLGKSTLLRVINFCLGSDLRRDKTLSHPDLKGVTFSLQLEGKVSCIVHRNTAKPNLVSVSPEFLVGLPFEYELENGLAILELEDWKNALSERFVPEARMPDDRERFNPSFREFSRYLIRLGKQAYTSPQVSYGGQAGNTRRINTSFLLGLNWLVQRQLHALEDARSRVKAAAKAIAAIETSGNERSIGDLEADRVLLEKSLADKEAEVSQFNLREDYHDLEEQLEAVDQQIHALVNQNYSDGRLLSYYRESSSEAPLFDADGPARILKDAGALFRPEALRSLDEVAAFHREIHANRSQFLEAETKRLSDQVSLRRLEIDQASQNKSDLMKILSSSGAIDSLIALQRSVSDISIELEKIKTRIEDRKVFELREDELTRELSETRTLLRGDLEGRRSAIDEAIGLFADYTRSLYGVAGKLGVDVGTKGYRFTFAIDRMGSDGVDQMVVFCFDLVLATLRARAGKKFLSLVHDSTMFADVDPRQYGLALQLAQSISEQEGFQYIVCLNVGALPTDYLGELDLDPFIKLRLHDANDGGRLLGVRLKPNEG